MIFMGEEFASEDPFLFFVDFKDPWVRDGVEKGRASEFPELNEKLDGLSPLDPQSFKKSKLRPWSAGDAETRTWYRKLIELRKKMRTCGLLDQQHLIVESNADEGLFVHRYEDDANGKLTVAVRLGQPNSTTETEVIEFEAVGSLILGAQNRVLPIDRQPKDPVTIGINDAMIMYDPA